MCHERHVHPPTRPRRRISPRMPKPELMREQTERLQNATATAPARARARGQAARTGMSAEEAHGLIEEELVLDGMPMRNLATFVTTWMEPQADRDRGKPAHELHRPRRVPADGRDRAALLPHDRRPVPRARGETTGARTQGSSEAIMLGALSLKWKWRARREAAGKATERPNLVFGGDVHVVLGEVLPLLRRRAADRPAGARQVHDRPRGRGSRKSMRTRSPSPACSARRSPDTLTTSAGSTTSSSRSSRAGPGRPPARRRGQRRFHHRRSSTPTRSGTSASSRSARSTSRPQVRPCLPRHRLACFPRESDLAEDLVFYENYLGKRDATFTLNFSTGSAMVLAQYYNFARLGHSGYRYIMETMQYNARTLARKLAEIGEFELIGGERGRAAPAGRVQTCRRARLRRVRRRRPARRRARLDGARLHAAAQRRAREDHARTRQADAQPLVDALGQDIAQACSTLAKKGGLIRPTASASKTNTRVLTTLAGRVARRGPGPGAPSFSLRRRSTSSTAATTRITTITIPPAM